MLKARSISFRALAVALVAGAVVLTLPSIVLGSSPVPGATSQFAPDRVMVRFRQPPSETDLEIFKGRQFLTPLDYVGLSYPPGLGWYLFHIDDGMDAGLVRDLLRKDPMVCNAELVALGERYAIGLPDANEALPCVELSPSWPPEASATQQPAAGGGTTADGSDPSGQPLSQVTPAVEMLVVLLASVLAVVGIAFWYRLRLRARA